VSVRLREAWLVVFARPPGQPTSSSANLLCFKKLSFEIIVHHAFWKSYIFRTFAIDMLCAM